MICKCRNCGGSVEWKTGDTAGVCKDCGMEQTVENGDVYRQARLLAGEGTEESLEQAVLLYGSIRGWQDADKQCADCRNRLSRMRWEAESADRKKEEARYEARAILRRRLMLTVLAAALLCFAVTTTVALVRFRRYSRATEYYTAGEYERAAAAFMEMGDYRDSKNWVYLSAVELYKARRFEKAIPYFVWLDGYRDNGVYLQRCRERLAAQENAPPETQQLTP